jgi:hypothetical protein
MDMRNLIRTGLILALLVLGNLPVHAEDMVSITGEAVDIPCFVAGKHGPDHATCSKACADKGEPLGILSKDASGKETLYLVIGSGGKSAKDLLADVMGKQVTATGLVSEKGGMKILSAVQVKAAAS